MAMRPGTKITTRGEQTRDQILQAARKLFTQQGYHYTSVYDLFDKAETTKGAFFHHWKTKEDLACSVLERMEAHFEEHFFSILEQTGRGRDQIEKALNLLGETNKADGGYGRLFAIWSIEMRQDEDKLGAEVHRLKLRWCGFWKELIQRAQKDRDIRSDISAEQLSFLVVASVCGVQLLKRETGPETLGLYEALRLSLLT